MTIMDLNDNREKARKALESMRGSMVSGLNDIMKTVNDTPAENKVRAIINDCARDTAITADVLNQYVYLLDDIMRLSTIEWPPVCFAADKR